MFVPQDGEWFVRHAKTLCTDDVDCRVDRVAPMPGLLLNLPTFGYTARPLPKWRNR